MEREEEIIEEEEEENKDFSTFAMLPEEMLEQVCEQMTNRSLLTFVENYPRAYHVCKRVYDKRFEADKAKKKKEKIRKGFKLAKLTEENREKEERKISQIGNLPDEAIYNLCLSADDQTLTNMSRNSAIIRRVCHDVLLRRGIKTQRHLLEEAEKKFRSGL